ncbi:MAG TPA: hypothetical protein VLA24_17925 [Pseudomonadales bacterium]|nr:hypothetical protein [Pseudomonadales bacterium]
MSATSEANSLEAFFAIGVQSAKGTAATAFYKTLATVSSLDVQFDIRDNRLEHPAASSVWLRAGYQTMTGYLANATVTFALRPKFIVPILQAVGYQVNSVNNTTYYTHTLTQGTNAAHKWMTLAWSVPDSDGAFVVRGVDCRAESLSIDVTTEEILCTATFKGLTVEPMAGSPTYTAEATDELLPWIGARTTLSCGISGSTYAVVERIRGVTINMDNPLRVDDKALWEPARTTLQRESHDVNYNFTGMNMSDSVYEAFFYGSDGGTTVSTAVRTGDVNLEWHSADDITGAVVPFRFEIDTPTVQWIPESGSGQASGSDLILASAAANVIGTGTPVTINIDNDVASY